ncbi:hypothetical protein ACQKIE_00125 [Luteibacter sp. NPDC031894]|uniref:hypothetical protein n=1 Tax=Luteibacter sp. NPDC031894 TaxID=3390572 RepID=UPI003CFDDB1C
MNADKQAELVSLTTTLMVAQSADRESDRAISRAMHQKDETREALRQAEWALSAFYAENRP